ncbi:probable beta-D-xylosidase 7 isoform X3 [Amaranthus tricolor]|uniref:probable beta-D-xylosidase 7 isoform X3 n=1 Tax=Amaranthus tricolor TaxID=29722 RepID=UPI00258FCBB9|nr:probable beta-D-xylosidase 7 isoform X3 [Amaranthus tricolor]
MGVSDLSPNSLFPCLYKSVKLTTHNKPILIFSFRQINQFNKVEVPNFLKQRKLLECSQKIISVKNSNNLESIMLFCAENGHIEEAELFWDEIQPNVHLVSTLIIAYAKIGELDKISGILNQLKCRRFSWLPQVYSLAIKCFGVQGHLDLMEQTLNDMVSMGFPVDSITGQGKGLTFWAPNINIFRDPRWGRGQETPGEDPLLTAKYGVSYVRGLQGYTFNGDKISEQLQASACCKHFTAHDLDNWHGITRYTFDAEVSKQDLADTFQPPFQSCVEEARASSIMCAYNRVNGIPSCAHYDFLTETARGQWHFDGYIVSDCNAVPIIYQQQGYAQTPEDAVADVLNAGMDVECGSFTPRYTKSALEQKKIAEEEIDRGLSNLFSVRMRLGLFNGDPRKKGSFGKIGPEQVCSEEHQNLALEAARNSIVLLKNSNNILPLLKEKTSSLAVIGPNADSSQVLLGNYEGFPCKNTTILEALQGYIDGIKYHPGCNAVECSSAEVEQAVDIAKEVDYVVLVMGLDQTQEREKMDRVDLVLPGKQQNLISSVAQAAKKPVVLVLLCGGPVDISLSRDDDKVGSILWAGYPGEAGGLALAEIIFGDHNPGLLEPRVAVAATSLSHLIRVWYAVFQPSSNSDHNFYERERGTPGMMMIMVMMKCFSSYRCFKYV